MELQTERSSMFRLSLKTKMSIAVSLLVTVLMAGLAFWFIINFNRRFKENIAAQQFVLISERANDLDETIRHIQQILIAKAADFSRMNVKNPVQAQYELGGEPELLTLCDHGVFLFSTTGELIAEFPNLHRQGMNFAYRDYFKKTMETGKPYISAPFSSSKTNHQPVIMFTAPVFGKTGKIISILAGSIDLMQDNFLGRNTQLKIGKTGYAYIYNTERTIIMHPDRNRILKQDELPGVNKVFDKGITGFEGTEENVNSRGLHALTTVKRLKSVNWIMGANYPLADAYAPIREATRNSIIAVLVGLMLSVMIVWWGMHLLTAPLMLLIRHIREISEHSGTGQEIRIDSGDEIEELAISFNMMMRIITGEKEELQKLSRAVEQSASLVAITGLSGNIEYANPKFCKLTGYGFDEVIGQNPRILNSGHTPAEYYRELWKTILTGREWQGEFHNKKKNGEIFWTVVTISPIKNERGEITNFCCVQEDITERKRAEEALEESNRKLEALSITDGLTGIANRRCFDDILLQEHARHARSRAELSLILLDIDNFKLFNDRYGHVSGDECLRQVARVIADCCERPADLAARYGGEEFACILPETDYYGALAIAEKIRRSILALEIPNKDSNVAEYVTASLGVVTVPCTVDESVLEIVAQVDDLLYRAKSNGRNRVEFIATRNVESASTEETGDNLIQLVWKDSFCCGNKLIDSQHQSLFNTSNDLLEKVLSSRPSSEISALIYRLINDVRQHFHDEEIILESIGFPGLSQHAAEHEKLLAKGLTLSQEFKTSSLSVGDVFQFLAYEVVMLHMLGADREFFPFTKGTTAPEPDEM